MNIEPIARIHTDFPTKFGVPRQSGLASGLVSTIVFEPPYRNPDCLRGIADFSHLWLIWEFDKVAGAGWSPTVLPPKLGLSCVQLVKADLHTKDGPVLYVAGADLVDGTPVYDIKPYLPYADSHPEAVDGFDGRRDAEPLTVVFPPELEAMIPEEKREGLRQALACGPVPGYQHDPERRYGFNFAGFDVRFRIRERVLTVVEIVRL